MFDIRRRLRKISEFDEKAKLLEWKNSAVKATSFAFGSPTNSKEMMGSCEEGSNRFIINGYSDQQTLPPARFWQLSPEKNAPRISKFLTYWRPLAAKTSELLVSNSRGLVPLVKQFNRAKEVFDIRCRYGDYMSRIWYLAEDRRFLWKGEFAGMENVGRYSYLPRVRQTNGE